MMGDNTNNTKVGKQSDSHNVVGFPQSRTPAKQSNGGFKELGLSKLAQKGGELQSGLKGHWCSRCKGIWFGFVGECECPQCGNRNG